MNTPEIPMKEKKYSLYAEASKCFQARLVRLLSSWMFSVLAGGLLLAVGYLLLLFFINKIGLGHLIEDEPRPSLVTVSLIGVFLGLFFWVFCIDQGNLLLIDINHRVNDFDNRIVPDAGLMRIAQSRAIPDGVKQKVAELFQKQGELRFNDLKEIDQCLQEHWNTEQYLKNKEQRIHDAGAVALQAFLNARECEP